MSDNIKTQFMLPKLNKIAESDRVYNIVEKSVMETDNRGYEATSLIVFNFRGTKFQVETQCLEKLPKESPFTRQLQAK